MSIIEYLKGLFTKVEDYPTNNIYQLINDYRIRMGRKPLTISPILYIYAYDHARKMAKYKLLVHSELPYFENVGVGYNTAEAMFNGWRNSRGHNENMLQDNVTQYGVAAAKSNSPYWCLILD
jgi:uncharacterized protein YkwD